ncbi:MAG: DUF6282 family protein [Nocardioidaceae bacterium]
MTGWFDGHVHAAPDVIARRADDMDLALHYRDSGARGFVLKAHYESTVGRANAARRASGLTVVGGVALNHATGGISAATVLAALRSGGRVVWMPTADARIHAERALPRLCDLDARVTDATLALPPVDPSTEDEVRRILDLIAEHDAVLATGHVSGPEVFWLIEAARAHGVRRVIATHPAYVAPGLSVDEIAELAGLGAHIEITAHQLLHQPGCTSELLAAVAGVAGDQLLLTSDVGQTDSPSPREALEWLAAQLATAGADADQLRRAWTSTPAALFGAT